MEGKKLLIVVDYQKDFVDGALGFEGASDLDKRIVEKIEAYRSEGSEVVFTFDTHGKNYLMTQEGRKLPVPHCIEGEEGWALYGQTGTAHRADDRTFRKPAFGSMELAEYLKQGAYTQIELVGLVSNICVLVVAVLAKTALPEAEILIDASCTASFDAKLHEEALNVMEGLQMTILNRA